MALDGREQLMQDEKMSNDSVDRYSFVKQSDFQRQLFKIYDGNPPAPEEHDHILYFLDDID
ncbi:ABC transporter [Alishewanella longhuensis]